MTGFADEFYEDHVESMLDEDFPRPLHSLSPQELADQGIPVEVALRAKVEQFDHLAQTFTSDAGQLYAQAALGAYRDALAIIEAQR